MWTHEHKMTSAKIKRSESTSAISKSAKNNAKIQGARKFKERENSRSAKARMQKREIEGPKKSAKAPARRVSPGSAKAQARRLKKARAQLCNQVLACRSVLFSVMFSSLQFLHTLCEVGTYCSGLFSF
jgi:hypothetical protein